MQLYQKCQLFQPIDFSSLAEFKYGLLVMTFDDPSYRAE